MCVPGMGIDRSGADLAMPRRGGKSSHRSKASLGLPRALNNAASAALIAGATTGKALVDDDWMLLCQEAKAGSPC